MILMAICCDWHGDAWLTFDWSRFEDVKSISLFEVRDDCCFFSMDLDLGDFMPEGTRLDIDDEWNVHLSDLLRVARYARNWIDEIQEHNMQRQAANRQPSSSFIEPQVGECPICFDKTFCMFSCGHHCCKKCFVELKKKDTVNCPVCRQQIMNEVRPYI